MKYYFNLGLRSVDWVRIHIPALKGSFYPLEVSGDVFSWDPV